MSGAEAIAAIQLIDACIGIATTIIDIGRAVHDDQGLPPKLRGLLEKLPTIEELLESARDNFEAGKVTDDTSNSTQPILKQCEQALSELRELFRKAFPKDGEQRTKRIWRGAKTVFLGRDSQVQKLLVVVQDNLQLLEQKEIYVIGDKLDELKELTEALGHEDGGKHTHTGAGHIIANEGGNPTNYFGGCGNSRQINNPGVYNEGPNYTYNYSLTGSALDDTLCSLPIAKDAPFNAYRRQHDPTCLPDTRVDLLKEIYAWADSDDSPSIFWLSGLAGTGKSTVAKTVAAFYHAQDRLAASFFFSRAGADVSHAGKFITSIAFQLAFNVPSVKSKICDAITRRGNIAEQSIDDQWRELVIGPLSSLAGGEKGSKYILVVDALDECNDGRTVQVVLQRLSELRDQEDAQLRVFLTGRPDVPVQYGFTQMRRTDHQDFVLHHIEPAIIEHDISVLLRDQLTPIWKNFQPDANGSEKGPLVTLVRNSGGLFIWAATACRFILEDSRLSERRLHMLLDQQGDNTLPPARKLDEIYTTVLKNSVVQGEFNEADVQFVQRTFQQVVGTIVILQDPLSVSTLAELLGQDVATIRRGLNNLGSVLDVPEDDSLIIRLLHPSFRDFLLDPTRCSDPRYYINERLVHSQMYRGCLQTMSTHLRRDICDLQDPGARVFDQDRDKVDRHVRSSVQYACRFWVDHFTESEIESGCYEKVADFLEKSLLHWMEALALLRRASETMDAVDKLSSVSSSARGDAVSQATTSLKRPPKSISHFREKLKASFRSSLHRMTGNESASQDPRKAPRSRFRSIINDAARFILAFRHILQEAPLQLYFAALVFSPHTSIIKNTFSYETAAWLRYMPEVPEGWNPCLHELEIWNEDVSAIAFSPDGGILATTSKSIIKLWDVGSGKTLLTTKRQGQVHDVTFSLNGDMLASASGDIVEIWHTRSRKLSLEQTLIGHGGDVLALAFSPVGNTLASASADRSLRLWDVGTGKVLQTLWGLLKCFYVAYSMDGKILAAAGGSNLYATVCLWDLSSGAPLRTLSQVFKEYKAIALSPDGKTLAVARYGELNRGSIELWDVSSDEASLKKTLGGRLDLVDAVAFSPDGKTLASGSSGPFTDTVKLWDVDAPKKAPRVLWLKPSPIYHVRMKVKHMAYTADGKMLASTHDCSKIQLWDVGSSGAVQQKLTRKGHAGPVEVTTFSPDGKMLASGCRGGEIMLWDAADSGKPPRTLRRSAIRIAAMAFSPDSKWLVSVSRPDYLKDISPSLWADWSSYSFGFTATIWDLSSGRLLGTLKDPNPSKIPWQRYLEVDLWLELAEQGRVPDSGLPAPAASASSVHVEGDWISRHGKKILWLPSEYRPSGGLSVATHGNSVGIGSYSGNVLILRFVP